MWYYAHLCCRATRQSQKLNKRKAMHYITWVAMSVYLMRRLALVYISKRFEQSFIYPTFIT